MSAFDRRSVLLGGATLLGAIACPRDSTQKDGLQDAGSSSTSGDETTVSDILPTLVAFADRLLPTDETGPGAKDAGIDQYFAKVLADKRMAAIRRVVTRGAVWTTRAAKREHGVPFAELSDERKDDLIQRLVDNKVRPQGFTPPAFVRIMLALTLEGFLGDPRHGGNKNQMGWNFVGGINWAGRTK
jgi:hypothetical protein